MGRMGAVGLAVVAAAIGAGVALLVGSVAGLGGTPRRRSSRRRCSRAASTTAPPSAAPSPGTASTRRRSTPPARPVSSRSTRTSGIDGTAQGSGFVVDRDGAILTNAHVITNAAEARTNVQGARAVYVEFADGERISGRVVGWDLFSDVGVIRVSPADHGSSPSRSGTRRAVVVGEPVAAIGSPFGKQSSLTVGVVSAIGRSIDSLAAGGFTVSNAIQTDAPINRGNSGGPLFDGDGSVIGINAQIQSTTGTNEGVGFAIPIDLARRSLDQLLRTGKVRYAYIGVSTQDVTPGIAARFRLGATRGALVTRVEDGSPAARQGCAAGERTEAYNGLDVTLGGDLIVAIAGTPVEGADDVSRLVTTKLSAGPDGDLHRACAAPGGSRSPSRSATARPRGDGPRASR